MQFYIAAIDRARSLHYPNPAAHNRDLKQFIYVALVDKNDALCADPGQ